MHRQQRDRRESHWHQGWTLHARAGHIGPTMGKGRRGEGRGGEGRGGERRGKGGRNKALQQQESGRR